MNEVVPIIDKAANAGDRWLFIALLVIGLFAIWVVFKYFTKRCELLDSKVDETNKYVRDKLATIVVESTSTIEENTTALREVKAHLPGGTAFNLARAKTPLVIASALLLQGCAFTGTVRTPYGSVSSDGKAVNVQLEIKGFRK